MEYHCFLPDHGQYNMTTTTLSLELRSGICAARFGELLPFSTPHCFTYLNHPLFTTREWCWEDNFKVGCIYEKGRYETQKGATLRYGKIITAPLYQQRLTLLLLLRPFNYRYQKLIDNKLAFLQTY